MSPVFQAVLKSWSIPPAVTLALCLSALLYLRGWRLLRKAGVPFLPRWRAIALLLGLFSLWFALASPLDTFSGFVLAAHMLQHMLLMMVAPPLILLGDPLIPIVRGLPIFAAREFAGPFLNWSVSKKVGRTLTNPVCAVLLMGVVMFAWHFPILFELALRSTWWHEMEHACFFLTSLIFWWPVVQPWSSPAQWSRWAMVPYLLLADLQNTTLSAILAFSDRVLYPSYASMPRLFGFSALEDQVAAGATMWLVGSLAFIVPAITISLGCLSRHPTGQAIVSADNKKECFRKRSLSVPRPISFVFRCFRPRLSGRRFETVSFVVIFAITALSFAGLSSSSDDDQSLRLNAQSGSFAVAVFAPPGDLEIGPTNFSVLVQERATLDILLGAVVDLKVQPAAGTPATPIPVLATHERSQNKLLRAAELDLPEGGEWTLSIAVRHNSRGTDFVLPLRVVRRKHIAELPWAYLCIPAFAAVLLCVYIRRHRSQATVSHQISAASTSL